MDYAFGLNPTNDELEHGAWQHSFAYRGDLPLELLDRECEYTAAPHHKSLSWRRKKTTYAQLLLDALFHKPRYGKKDGRILYPGVLNSRQKKGEYCESFDLLGYDMDTGPDLPDIVRAIEKENTCCLIYRSYSDGKSESILEVADPLSWRAALESRGHPDSLIDSAALVGEPERIGGKFLVTVSHELINKLRLFVPLSERLFVEGSLEHKKRRHEAIYRAVGERLGIPYDPSGARLNQAFNYPRLRKDHRFAALLVGGEPLVVPHVQIPDLRRTARQSASPGAGSDGGGVPPSRLRSEFGRLIGRYGHRFDIVEYVDHCGWDIFEYFDEGAVIRCPNEQEHSNFPEEDNACVVLNPDSEKNPSKYACITCLHAHCAHLRTSDFLTMITEAVETPPSNFNEYLYTIEE